MSSKTLTAILVLVLILVAGYFFIGKKGAPQTGQPQTGSQPPTTSQTSETTAKQQLVASFPDQNATPDQQADFTNKVAGAAEDTTTLEITNCEPKPEILHVKIGRAFKLKNNDNVAHVLSHPKDIRIEVGANGERQVTLREEGIYGFACDATADRRVTIGIFFVTPP